MDPTELLLFLLHSTRKDHLARAREASPAGWLDDWPGSGGGVGLSLSFSAAHHLRQPRKRAFHDGIAAHLLVSRVRWWMIVRRLLRL